MTLLSGLVIIFPCLYGHCVMTEHATQVPAPWIVPSISESVWERHQLPDGHVIILLPLERWT
jgi:hypothetical protein